MPAVGRRRQTDLHLPPRMRRKGHAYYYDAGGKPRRYIPLGSDLAKARVKWAELANETVSHTFRTLAEWYRAAHLPALAPNTRSNYEYCLRPLEAVFGDMPLDAIRPEHVATYLDDHASPTSANHQIAVLSSMFEKAMRRGWADRNPTRGIRRNSVRRRGRYLTDGEYTAIRAAADPVLRAAMDIGYLTSLRPVDIAKLRRADIRPEGLYVCQQKTGARQFFAVTPELDAAIRAARAISEVDSVFLLCSRNGQPITAKSLGHLWRKAARAAGIHGSQLRDIRAKSATDAKDAGQDYQALLGHTTRAMSDSYIKPKIINRVEPLRKKL